MKNAFGLLALLVFVTACGASLPPPQPVSAVSLRDATGETVAVVKVKSPWYATRGIITGKFRHLVPEYQAADGLLAKQFSFSQKGEFGGIYLWRERALADRWFGPAWHTRVKKQRGVDGDVVCGARARGIDAAA